MSCIVNSILYLIFASENTMHSTAIRFKRTKPVEARIVCKTMCVKIGSYCCVFIAPFHVRKHSPPPYNFIPYRHRHPSSSYSSPHYRKHRGVRTLVTSTFTDNNHTARRWKRKPSTRIQVFVTEGTELLQAVTVTLTFPVTLVLFAF